MEKRLRKISKQEALSVKLLEKQVSVDQVRVLCSHMSLSQEQELEKALQENRSYLELVDLGISQEQAKKKATKLPEGDSETVSRLKQENKQLKSRLTDRKI